MPKVSGSYQGVTMQPQFPTYQTAGMLRPQTPPVTPPITQPPAPPPVVPPVTPPVITPPTTPTTGGGGPTTPPVVVPPTPPVVAVPEDRERLVKAIMRSRVEE